MGHGEQRLFPAKLLNVPAAQSVHEVAEPAPMKLPMGQTEHARRPADAALVPAAQAVQLVEPLVALTDPAGHFWHKLPRARPTNPALHCVQAVAPADELNPRSHSKQDERSRPCW